MWINYFIQRHQQFLYRYEQVVHSYFERYIIMIHTIAFEYQHKLINVASMIFTEGNVDKYRDKRMKKGG